LEAKSPKRVPEEPPLGRFYPNIGFPAPYRSGKPIFDRNRPKPHFVQPLGRFHPKMRFSPKTTKRYRTHFLCKFGENQHRCPISRNRQNTRFARFLVDFGEIGVFHENRQNARKARFLGDFREKPSISSKIAKILAFARFLVDFR